MAIHERLNSEKYSKPARWQELAACRKMDPDFFTSWENKEAAILTCGRCAVARRCDQEPSLAWHRQGISLIGVWGGKWHPLDMPEPQPIYRQLLQRMLLESDSDSVWHGDIKNQSIVIGATEEETVRAGRYLADHAFAENIGDNMWRLQNVPSGVTEMWMHVLQIADSEGRFKLDIENAIEKSGLKSKSQVYRFMQHLKEQNFVHRTTEGEYRINMAKAGTEKF